MKPGRGRESIVIHVRSPGRGTSLTKVILGAVFQPRTRTRRRTRRSGAQVCPPRWSHAWRDNCVKSPLAATGSLDFHHPPGGASLNKLLMLNRDTQFVEGTR